MAAYPGDQAGPAKVTRAAHLHPITLIGERPKLVLPGQIGVVERITERLVAGRGVDEHFADHPRTVELADDARHDVEPLVGDDEDVVEICELVRQRRASGSPQPPDTRRQFVGSLDDVDSEEWSVRAVGVQCADELAPARSDVDDARELEQVGIVPDRFGQNGT